MKRKIPPMPVDFYATNPKVLAMNSAAYGAVARLMNHFWLTDCSPLPSSDHALYVLARAHKPTWKANRDDIKAVLRDVMPELAKALALYRSRSSILRGLSERGNSARRAEGIRKVIAQPSDIPIVDSPRREERSRAAKIAAPVKVSPRSGFRDTSI
jgi:hypothetical protein